MASYSVATGSVEARKIWSPLLDAETIPRTVISKFFSETGASVIHLHNDLERESGDRIRTFLRGAPSATVAPVQAGVNLEGNEQSITNYEFDFLIDQEKYAVRIPFKNPSAQRVPYELKAQAKAQSSEYWRQYLDTVAFHQLCGATWANYLDLSGTGTTSTVWNGHNTIADYAAGRIVFPNTETTDDGLDSSGDTLTRDLIRKAVLQAKTNSPRLRTINVPGLGQDVFVMFVHPIQLRDLKDDTDFENIQLNLLAGGQVKDNLLITGAAGLVDGVLLVESEYVTYGVNSSTGVPVTTVRRAVLCGQQALSCGFGRWDDSFSRFDWVEKTFNYEDEVGIASKVLFGMARTVYNDLDYGSICVPTYAVA